MSLILPDGQLPGHFPCSGWLRATGAAGRARTPPATAHVACARLSPARAGLPGEAEVTGWERSPALPEAVARVCTCDSATGTWGPRRNTNPPRWPIERHPLFFQSWAWGSRGSTERGANTQGAWAAGTWGPPRPLCVHRRDSRSGALLSGALLPEAFGQEQVLPGHGRAGVAARDVCHTPAHVGTRLRCQSPQGP